MKCARLAFVGLGLFLAACSKAPPEPEGSGLANAAERDQPIAAVPVSADDPLHGKFTLQEALAGLPPGKDILATIETDMGSIVCKLYGDRAPITVANFVGLARGTRPWKTPDGTWQKKPAYDDTVFHRVVKDFMIQGGDAKKDGSGDAGYVIPDEVWKGAAHDRAGLLCMANRGANTSSAQFFITDAPAPHLDKSYTIFGECSPEQTIHSIASVPVDGDRPKKPPVIKNVRVTRR